MFGQDKKEHGEKTEVALVCTHAVLNLRHLIFGTLQECVKCRGGEALKNVMILIRFREYDSILIQLKAVD